MAYIPNRKGLKELAGFNVDTQFCQQLGTRVFNPNEDGQSYQDLCRDFRDVVADSIDDLNRIAQLIPVFK